MKDNNVSNHKLAGWIDDFISNLVKKDTNKDVIESELQDDRTTVAEINIKDLPTVIWNDETYYVFLDNNTANIINGFGNTVTTLKDVMTLEDVNNELSGKQIVSEINESNEIDAMMADEIQKALAYVDKTADDETQSTDEFSPSQNTEFDPGSNDQATDSTDSQSTDSANNQTTDSVDNQTNNSTTQSDDQGMTISSGVITLEESPYIKKFAEFEANVMSAIDQKFNQLSEQLYARIDPKNIYDLSQTIISDEIKKFQEAANNTIQQILRENTIDRTTPEGKYSTSNNMQIDNIESDNEDDSDKELSENDSDIFKTGKCPYCGETLIRNGIDGDYVNIKCNGCDVDYKVDTNTEKIYLRGAL